MTWHRIVTVIVREKLYVFINLNFTCIIAYISYIDAAVAIRRCGFDVGYVGKGE